MHNTPITVDLGVVELKSASPALRGVSGFVTVRQT